MTTRLRPEKQSSTSESSSSSSHNLSSTNTTCLMDENDHKYKKMSLLNQWKGAKDFCKAQVQVVVVLVIAYIGNNWPKSYHRNENHNPSMFWAMNIAILIAAVATLTHDPNASSRGVQLLSRAQTEEWKGWMQWAFIMVRRVKCCLFLRRVILECLTTRRFFLPSDHFAVSLLPNVPCLQ